jgi:hypothetical protein
MWLFESADALPSESEQQSHCNCKRSSQLQCGRVEEKTCGGEKDGPQAVEQLG